MEQAATTPKRHRHLDNQFGHPSGVLGALVGIAMAVEHKDLHRAVVERLGLDSADRVLEVGFGPGTAIKLASRQAAFVAGIEPSREMIQQAARRNRSAIESKRVEVLRASVSAIPYPDDSFSVVFEVNSFHHWDRPEVGLKEVIRVLKPGGHLLLAIRQAPARSIQPEAQRLTKLLTEVGFSRVELEEHHLGHGGAFLTARR